MIILYRFIYTTIYIYFKQNESVKPKLIGFLYFLADNAIIMYNQQIVNYALKRW
jgi:hypothetical protein